MHKLYHLNNHRTRKDQRNEIGLPVRASFLEQIAHVKGNGCRGDAEGISDVRGPRAACQQSCNPSFGRCEPEQINQ